MVLRIKHNVLLIKCSESTSFKRGWFFFFLFFSWWSYIIGVLASWCLGIFLVAEEIDIS